MLVETLQASPQQMKITLVHSIFYHQSCKMNRMIQQSIQRDENVETGSGNGVVETANAVMAPAATPATNAPKPAPVKPEAKPVVKAASKPVQKPAVIKKPVQKPKQVMPKKNDY